MFHAYDKKFQKLSKKDMVVDVKHSSEEMVLDLQDWSVTTMTGETPVIGYDSELTIGDA